MNSYSEFSCLPKIQQEILLYIKSNPCSFSSVIFNNLPDDAKVSNSHFYDSLKQLMAKQLITRNGEVKSYTYVLTLLGKQITQPISKKRWIDYSKKYLEAGISIRAQNDDLDASSREETTSLDHRFVRLRKTFSEYSIVELQPGNLERFKKDILLSGKWGSISLHVTIMNWEKFVIISNHSFSKGIKLEFRFSHVTKFQIYHLAVFGKDCSEALTKAQEQARSLESCFRDHFLRFGLDIVDGYFNFDSKVVNDNPDDSSREETARGVFDALDLDIHADGTG